MKKKNMKIAGATSVVLFSLVTVFTATIAWFSSNKRTSGEGMSIKVYEQGKVFTTLSVHRCKTNVSTSSLLKFYSDPEVGAINLDYYSQLNMTQPVLLLFKLTDGGAPSDLVHLTSTSTATAFYSAISETSTAPNYYGKFPFSSAVCFRTIPITTNSFDYENVSLLNPDIVFSSFVDVSSSYAWDGPTIDLYQGTDPDVTLYYIAVIIDYYQDSLSYIYSQNLTNSHDLVFYCDFTIWIS